MSHFEFKVLNNFKCVGIDMVIIILRGNAHVMTVEEWKKVYGRNNQERWKNDSFKVA